MDKLCQMGICLKNAIQIGHSEVKIPYTKIAHMVANILKTEGFVEKIEFSPTESKVFRIHLKYTGKEKKSSLTHFEIISKPNSRVYSAPTNFPRVLGGMGIVILSTSQGILTDSEAKKKGIGGEILCFVW